MACRVLLLCAVKSALNMLLLLLLQVFCQEQPGRDGSFYRCFVAADYAGLWAHCERSQQRHFYEASPSSHTFQAVIHTSSDLQWLWVHCQRMQQCLPSRGRAARRILPL